MGSQLFDCSIFQRLWAGASKPVCDVEICKHAVNKGQAPVVYGDGSQIRSFCHVDDAVRGFVDVGLAPETQNEIINIGNNHEPISMRDLAQRVIKNSGKALLPKFVSLEQSDRAVSREISRRIPDIAKARVCWVCSQYFIG